MARQSTTAVFFFVLLGCISSNLGSIFDVKDVISEAPYHAAIEVKGKYLCAATIVDESYVITSKSCVQDLKVAKTNVTVRVGTGKLTYKGQVVQASAITYDSKTDFAMVQTADKIKFTSVASWVNPNNGGVKASMVGSVTAWKNKAKKQSKLMIAPVKTVSYKECASLLNSTYTMLSTQFCLEPTVSTSKSCLADLGAPFYLSEQLYGIVSYAPGCSGSQPLVISTMASGSNFVINTLTGGQGGF